MRIYSIIYSDEKNAYYIISDANCSNKLIPMNLLFGNLNEDEIIVHTEYIKVNDKISEKEKINFYEEESYTIFTYLKSFLIF